VCGDGVEHVASFVRGANGVCWVRDLLFAPMKNSMKKQKQSAHYFCP
jgi:hypothetical protein